MRAFLLSALLCTVARSSSDGECASLGFATGSLPCASCAKLASLVADDALEKECLACCQAPNGTATARHSHAR